MIAKEYSFKIVPNIGKSHFGNICISGYDKDNLKSQNEMMKHLILRFYFYIILKIKSFNFGMDIAIYKQ